MMLRKLTNAAGADSRPAPLDPDEHASPHEAVETLRIYKDYAQVLGKHELEKALRQLRNGKSTEEVAALLTRNLVRKLTHNPSVILRSAVARGDSKLPNAVRVLFGLNDNRDA